MGRRGGLSTAATMSTSGVLSSPRMRGAYEDRGGGLSISSSTRATVVGRGLGVYSISYGRSRMTIGGRHVLPLPLPSLGYSRDYGRGTSA